MKSFKEFCVDANIKEFWNPFASKSQAKPQAKPNTKVLAYKNYQSGVLDKSSGKFTQRAHTGTEQQRYGWKPVKASVYTPGDRFTPNAVTATGDPHNWSTRNAAVPFKYPEGGAPKGREGQPSMPYGSSLSLTAKPTGKSTKVSKAKINDVGDFGKTGNVNKEVSFDLSPQTVRDVTGDRSTPGPTLAKNWGKGTVYAKVTPPATAKPKPKK